MICSGINSMSGNQYFHLLTTSKNFHQRQCSLMIIQKVAMANLGISLEIYFSMFYHFYHGLLYCSMDRHGCPDGYFWMDEDYRGNREKEHHLVLINTQSGVS